jgi:Caspase domain/Putative peptidoglycan binding domain
VTRRLQLVVTGVLGALLLALASHTALAEKRVALVVGNSNYKFAPRLPNPQKDAEAVAKLFRDAGFDAVVEANNVGNLDFKRAIRKFEDAALSSDIAVVYYAGHGIEVRGVNYLVPVNARLASDRDAQDEAITLNRIVESVDGAKQLRLVILDACRDNPFVATMKHFGHRSVYRSITSGLGQVEPTGTNTLIAYAAKAGSTAADGEGQHSPFTSALLDNLTVPGLDIRLAFGRVRDEVLKMTGRRQEPFVYGSLGGGTIALVPAPKKPKPPDVSKVKNDYALVAKIGTEKAWEVFLATYPTGFYADLARAQIAKLKRANPPPTVMAKLEPPPQHGPAKPTSDEKRAWNRVKDSSDRKTLEKFIERYPDSPLAVNVQHRLDILDRMAKDREAKERAAREAALRAAHERLTKEAARIAEKERAEEEKQKKEAAHIAALKAENERRAQQTAESDKQKKQQAARIATLQAEIDRRSKQLAKSEWKKAQLACAREQARLDDLKGAGSSPAVHDDLQRMSQDLTCESLRPQVVAALDNVTSEIKKSEAPPPPPENTPELVEAAQKELARLGCFSGAQDGILGPKTKIAIKKYQKGKDQPLTDVAVTDDFVKDLGKEKLRVCPAAIVERPEPEHDRKETKRAKRTHSKSSKSKETRRQKPRASQRASSGGGGHPAMIGIGF